MKLNEQNEVTCYACLDDNFNTIPAGTLLSGPADNLSNGQVPGAPEGTYCDFTVQWGDESWQVGYIGGIRLLIVVNQKKKPQNLKRKKQMYQKDQDPQDQMVKRKNNGHVNQEYQNFVLK